MKLRNNRSPQQYLQQLRSMIELVKKAKPTLASGLNKVLKILNYQFESPKPVNQCLEQLAQIVSNKIKR